MNTLKKIANPAEITVSNYMQAVNAYADQQHKSGERPPAYLSAANAKNTYGKVLKMLSAFANPNNPKHNSVYETLKKELGNNIQAMNSVEAIGHNIMTNLTSLAKVYSKNGYNGTEAIDAAFNASMGNPVYDFFGNLGLLANQLYQEKIFVERMIAKGDAYSVPTQDGAMGTAVSRFRIPTKKVTGSAKQYQGDINPQSNAQIDANRLQLNLNNEFKDADTLYHAFTINQDERNQVLGYQKSIAPALAGFILQNEYFLDFQEQILKLAEFLFVDGLKSGGAYIPNVGGAYGILSDSIMLELASAGAAEPLPATGADWLANPTKLIQRIHNFYAQPDDITAPLPASLGTVDMYKDIVRLFSLAAISNVDFGGEWTLFVPSSFYALGVQYPATGTFNKQLMEMLHEAVGDRIIKSIEILPSSLLDYRVNRYGATQYNSMIAMAHSADTKKKPVIMPGQTALPTVVSNNVSSQVMNFETFYSFGGPMVIQYGGCFVMDFSVQAS